jgi:hypothetical protein
MLQAGSANVGTGDLRSGLACGSWPRLSRVMAGQPHLFKANHVPPLIPVPQFHAVGRDADDPEPAPTPGHLHPGIHPNPGPRRGPLRRRRRSYPTSLGVRGWAPRRVGLATDHRARRLRPPCHACAQILVASGTTSLGFYMKTLLSAACWRVLLSRLRRPTCGGGQLRENRAQLGGTRELEQHDSHARHLAGPC